MKKKEEPKKDDGLYQLIFFLIMVASFAMLLLSTIRLNDVNDKLDQIQAQENINQVLLMQDAERDTSNESNPFCYGFAPDGTKGYAVDGRRVLAKCEGVE